jgi:hypothetical protein
LQIELCLTALLELADEPQRPCAEADAIAQAHLADIESKIARLQLLRSDLKRMLTECGKRRIRECRVIELLASHDECTGEHGANPSATKLKKSPKKRSSC